MKKIISILIIAMIIYPSQSALAFGKKKKKLQEEKGYYGRLPKINSEFGEDRQKNKETSSPIILDESSFDVNSKDLKEAPLNNNQYIDVIVKKGSTSQYVNDINELVPILKKLRECVEQEKDIQKFNAVVSNYIDNVAYIEKKYKNQPEIYYVSYEKISDMAKYAKKVAITRTEALTYNKYLGYNETDRVYSPENIKNLLENTLVEIQETLDAIKEAK